MSRRTLLAGVAIIGAYVLVLGVSHARVLYDGFIPPPKYQFVQPPEYFAPGNVKPGALTTDIALTPNGSALTGFATPDGQFVVNLPVGAIAPRAGATSVHVRITPLAPQKLAALPGGLRADGNAYRVEMTYEPGRAPVTRIENKGTLLVEFPEIGNGLFVSTDGTAWTRVPARTLEPRELSVAADFTRPGIYEVGTNLPELTNGARTSSHRALWIGTATVVVALGLFAGAFVLRRRRVRTGG